MGFWVGLVLGVAVGVAIIVGFARCENSRAAGRRKLVRTRFAPPDLVRLLPRFLEYNRCVLLAIGIWGSW